MFHINVEGVILRDNKWLVIERSKKETHAGGLLSLVGGTVEHEGDSANILERTLKRELYEEVGIQIKDEMVFVRNTSFKLPNGSEVLDIVFLCEIEKGEPFAKSPDEVEAVYWMTTEEIMESVVTPIWLKESIQAAATLVKVGIN